MRILLLTHSFNSLTQRLWCDLRAQGHEISVEYDIADAVTEEAIALFQPDLLIAPFLKRAIPESVWAKHPCFIVHPGIVGDRGPSALDWAVQDGARHWGVTVLQAEAEMDAGPVWASATFPIRPASKASLYRQEVTEAASFAVTQAIARWASGSFTPTRPDADAPGRLRPLLRQAQRQIDWQRDTNATVLTRLRAADSAPGVADQLFGVPCHLFDAWPESALTGPPGALIARRETAILRATADGAVWIGHIRREGGIKLPATLAFPEALALPEAALKNGRKALEPTWQDITYEESDDVGFLGFNFYNGAMSTAQCQRLQQALQRAQARPTRVIVLWGGEDYWSNGIHLNVIEADPHPADASWANIEAMNDLALTLLSTVRQLTVAALQGNAGAGGCFLARAADQVWVRDGALLNPHYRNMGNLYGSEYWTYLLPPRVGIAGARALMKNRLPMTASEAVACGFYDTCLPGPRPAFRIDVTRRAMELASAPDFAEQLAAKHTRRAGDEAEKPLAQYRAEELAEMHRNFYGFDPSYHVARHHFTHKSPASWTPRHLAIHR